MFPVGLVVAFSATDGHQLWSTQLPYQYSFSSAPTARNGMVYTSGAGEAGTVYGVRESDGALIWTQGVANGDSSAPAVTPDGVYVSYVCPQTYKFAPATGQLIWHYSGQCEGGGGQSAAVYRGLVYVRDLYNYPTDAITLSAATGAYVGGLNSKFSPAFWLNTGFYTEPATLSAVDLTSEQTLWTAGLNGDTYSCHPIVVNGIVYAGTTNGYVYGYDSGNGNVVFSIKVGSSISCSEYFSIPLVGMSAGTGAPQVLSGGLLVVPAGDTVVALQ